MGHDNLLISADYPWAMMELVETVYPEAVAMFAQGAGGDVNPVPHLRWSFGNARRMGHILGAEVVKVVNRILLDGCHAKVELGASSAVVGPPQEKQPSMAEAEVLISEVQREVADAQARLEERISAEGDRPEEREQAMLRHMVKRTQAGLLWAEMMADMAAKEREIPRRQCELQAMRLGDAILVSVAGEVFNELGRDVKDALGKGETFFLGYANGCCGYIPTPEAFAEGGHEVIFAQRMLGLSLLPEAGPTLMKEAIALARTL
jgi:hypothetical protein